MLKLLAVFAALIAIANCQLAGGWAQQESIPENVVELARFATTQLNADLKGTGIYTLMRVRNVQSQVVAGINYKFNMDAVFGDNNGKYSFKTCSVNIFTQSWTNTIKLNEPIKCVEATEI